MKYFILPVVMCCLLLVYSPKITAEVILEPQTSVSADTGTEPQTGTPVGAGTETQTATPIGTAGTFGQKNTSVEKAKPVNNSDIQGVTEYKIPDNTVTPQVSEETEPQKVDVKDFDKGFDTEEYLEETKMKLQDLDIMYDIVDKLKNEDGSFDIHSIDRWCDTFNQYLYEFGPKRSAISIFTRPNGNLFKSKNVRFACSGDYQLNGVYFNERDLNSVNGSQWEWDSDIEGQRRIMTTQEEAFIYHDLILNPRFEFAHGAITLHTQFQHGGYMWEMAFPNYHYDSPYFWAAHGQSTDLDTTQLKMTGLFLEALTPLGPFIAGKLPEDPALGITGIGWGLPIPPMFGFVGAGGVFYGKILEGMIWDDDRKGWEGHGWNYLEVQNSDGYKDQDDVSLLALAGGGMMNMPIIGGKIYGGGALVRVWGGDESMVFSDMELNILAGVGRYTNGSFKAHGIFATMAGDLVNIRDPDTYVGDLFGKMENLYAEAMDVMDVAGGKYRMYDIFDEMPKKMKFEPVFLAAGNAYFDLGPLRPEGCLIYAQGTDKPWEAPMVVPGFMFQSVGSKTPQGMLKSYLLNEVERKYFTLVANPGMVLVDRFFNFMDVFSTNLTAIKAGANLQLGEHFSVYGQALGAWRTDVEYYKENYWDYFLLTKALRDMQWSYDDNGIRQMEVDAILQFRNEDYHLDEVDNFIGTEISGKFTFHAREGLDISLIGAYFKPGGFYEDILTPKRYSSIKAIVSEVSGQVGFADLDEEIIYGPYEACRFFELTDTYSVQFKFDLKWDN